MLNESLLIRGVYARVYSLPGNSNNRLNIKLRMQANIYIKSNTRHLFAIAEIKFQLTTLYK